MKRQVRMAVVACTLLVGTALRAQLEFEVAAVKPSPPRDSALFGSQIQVQGDQVRVTNATITDLILRAYNFPAFLVSAGEAGKLQQRFDVLATTTAGFRGNLADVRLMLRQLLTDPFRLRAHTETRNMPVFELVQARQDGPARSKAHAFHDNVR